MATIPLTISQKDPGLEIAHRQAVYKCDDRFSLAVTGRNHSACENENSSRFPGTRRFASSELVRTSRKRQRFGSAVDFYSRSGQQVI